MIKPLWLESYIAVIETASFTQAAERLNLTQAAVSQHLQRLEHHCGSLILRQRRPMELTPAGKAVLDYAYAQRQAAQALQHALTHDDPYQGTIKISTPGSIGLGLHPLLLQAQRQHRNLIIEHRFAPTQDIHQRALQDDHAGLTTQLPDNPHLAARPFAQEKLCLLVPAEYTDPVSSATLQQLGFIDHPDGQAMATRLLSRNYPDCTWHQLPKRSFSNQINLILNTVQAGLGFTVLPEFCVQALPQYSGIRNVTLEHPVTDTLWLIHRKEWPLPQRVQRLFQELQQAMQNITPTT